jgi:hypothetical protein
MSDDSDLMTLISDCLSSLDSLVKGLKQTRLNKYPNSRVIFNMLTGQLLLMQQNILQISDLLTDKEQPKAKSQPSDANTYMRGTLIVNNDRPITTSTYVPTRNYPVGTNSDHDNIGNLADDSGLIIESIKNNTVTFDDLNITINDDSNKNKIFVKAQQLNLIAGYWDSYNKLVEYSTLISGSNVNSDNPYTVLNIINNYHRKLDNVKVVFEQFLSKMGDNEPGLDIVDNLDIVFNKLKLRLASISSNEIFEILNNLSTSVTNNGLIRYNGNNKFINQFMEKNNCMISKDSQYTQVLNIPKPSNIFSSSQSSTRGQPRFNVSTSTLPLTTSASSASTSSASVIPASSASASSRSTSGISASSASTSSASVIPASNRSTSGTSASSASASSASTSSASVPRIPTPSVPAASVPTPASSVHTPSTSSHKPFTARDINWNDYPKEFHDWSFAKQREWRNNYVIEKNKKRSSTT